ncbi:YdcF family protein [Actinoplanes sp. DH11]|uniref:YdcF family protein n=1 Tax=Actinoplanes sp. DH11 TaxID=2857011 RepID=UPI001E327B14|nr:YdcF family protein [Actinoplanes sp. DH11]
MASAAVLLVFGRGVHRARHGWDLTGESLERVRAAQRYVVEHATGPDRPRVIFTGGWAEAADGAERPPDGEREGDLMLRAAVADGFDARADLHAETRSRSTLENLLHTVQDGLLAGYEFDARHPLGLVTHGWHLPRVRFLAGKVLGLRGPALLDIPARGGEPHDERLVLLAARLGFLGTRRPEVLLRRERRLVTLLRDAGRTGYGRRPVG